MKKILSLLILLLLIGCASKSENVRIGFIGTLTGDLAIVGVENLRGVQLALDEINVAGGIRGKPVELIPENDEGRVPTGLAAYTKLIQTNRVPYVLMGTYGVALASAPLAESNQVVTISSLDASEELAKAGDWLLAIAIYDESIGYAQAEFVAQHLQLKKAALLYSTADPFALLSANAFKDKFAELGGETTVENYAAGDSDFRGQLLKIKASESPVLVLIGWDEAGLVVKQAKELGLEMPIIGIDTTPSEGFQKNAGDASEGMYYTSWEPSDPAFEERVVAAYQQKYGSDPEQLLFVAAGYDAMHALAQAIQETDGSPEAVRDWLLQMQNYPGLMGTLTMSPDGIVRTVKERIFQWKEGEGHLIE